MVKEINAKEVVEQDVKIGEEIVCDHCKKMIHSWERDPHTGKKNPGFQGNSYFSLTTGHHDWGMDSCESISHKELCSNECLLQEINSFLNEEKNSNTKYFDVASISF